MTLNKEVPRGHFFEKAGIKKGFYSLWKDIKFTLDDIINSGLHIGSLVKFSAMGTTWSWSYTVKDHSIFNLKIIYFNLRLLLRKLSWRSVFFVDIVYANFNRSLVDFIENWSLKTGVMYVIGKWFRGGVTNFYNFYAFLQKCRFDSSMFRKYSRYFCGIFSLTKMPDILFLSSNKDNFSRVLVKEAFTWSAIEMWLLNDSLVDPKHWSFVIPGNEKSMKSLSFIYNLFHNQIILGKLTSLYAKELILNREDLIDNRKSKYKLFNKKDNMIMKKKRFFSNENYLNRYITWFSYMRQRDLDLSLNTRFEKWDGRYSWLGFKKPSSKAIWFFLLTKWKTLRKLENFRWKKLNWIESNKRFYHSKLFANKPLLERFVGWKVRYKRRKRALFVKKIKNRFYKSPNYIAKIDNFRRQMVLYNNFKEYNISKNYDFFNFFKKIKKSQNLNILFEQEVKKQLSFKFDRNDKLGFQIWEYFDGRNMENWWMLHKKLYKDTIRGENRVIEEGDFRKNFKNRATLSHMVEKVGSETFNFNKIILKNNFFNSQKDVVFYRNLMFANTFSNFENDCLQNENYFKQKNRITVINYKN